MGRINTLQSINPFVGTYFSVEWIKKNVLHQSDEDIKNIADEQEIDKQNDLENAQHQGQVQLIQQQAALPPDAEPPQKS